MCNTGWCFSTGNRESACPHRLYPPSSVPPSSALRQKPRDCGSEGPLWGTPPEKRHLPPRRSAKPALREALADQLSPAAVPQSRQHRRSLTAGAWLCPGARSLRVSGRATGRCPWDHRSIRTHSPRRSALLSQLTARAPPRGREARARWCPLMSSAAPHPAGTGGPGPEASLGRRWALSRASMLLFMLLFGEGTQLSAC